MISLLRPVHPTTPRPPIFRQKRPGSFSGLVAISAANAVPEGFRRAASDTFGICFKLGIGHRVWSDGRNLDYPTDAICVRDPGCYWSCEATPAGFISIDLAASLLPGGRRSTPMRFLARGAHPALTPAALQRLASPNTDVLESQQIVTGILAALGALGALNAEELRDDSAGRRAIERARDYLVAHAAENPSLERLTAATGTNKFTLIRSFKQRLGITPHAFLMELRFARARWLLAHGSTPAEAAMSAGYADQAHLTREFRRRLATTPAVYARERRAVVSLAA